jgi:FtsP/CotA-like multicopper oxidase with cupredoxin domain
VVKNNERYRFRTINTGGASQCPIEIYVQEHHLTVISIDGNAVESKTVDIVRVEPGLVLNK